MYQKMSLIQEDRRWYVYLTQFPFLSCQQCFYMEIYKHFLEEIFICDGKNWPRCQVECSSIATQKLNYPLPIYILNNVRQSPLIKQNNRHEYELDQRQNSLCSNSQSLYVRSEHDNTPQCGHRLGTSPGSNTKWLIA